MLKDNRSFPYPAMVALLVILLLVQVVVGVTCNNRQEQKREFRIGVIAPITGNIPEVGQSTIDAANLVAREINTAGGLDINGESWEVVLIAEDNQDRAEVTASAALKLINQQNVIAIIGPQASRNAIPASMVAERTKIPMISPWSTDPETTLNKKWVFRVAFVDSFQGKVMARFAHEELGAQKVAVLFDIASDYNRELAEFFKASFEDFGGEVVAFESYTTDAPDVTEQMLRIKESGAEVLFLPNYYKEVPEQVRVAREVGVEAKIIGSDSWCQIASADRAIVEGSFFSTHYAVDIADEKAQAFVTKYREAYGRDPDDVAALTYDAFGLLFEAVRLQGKVNPDAVRDGLAAIELYHGVTGTMEYKGTGDPVKSAVILQIKEGRFVFYSRAEP